MLNGLLEILGIAGAAQDGVDAAGQIKNGLVDGQLKLHRILFVCIPLAVAVFALLWWLFGRYVGPVA